MIKRISLILCIFLFNSCEKQDENINPFIPDVSFEKTINLSLPNYDNLNYNGGSYFLQNVGVKGVILFNLNNSILAGKLVVQMKNHLIAQQWKFKDYRQNVNAILIFTV